MPAAASEDVQICDACNLVVRPASAYASHIASAAHLERVKGNFLRCPVCSICFLRGNWAGHIVGERHLKEAKRQGLRPNVSPEIPVDVSGHRKCHMCGIFVHLNIWNNHFGSPVHAAQVQARQRVEATKEALRRAKADKDGVTVSHVDGLDLGLVDAASTSSAIRAHLVVKANGNTPVEFVRGRILATSRISDASL
jgi:hypothetical protein